MAVYGSSIETYIQRGVMKKLQCRMEKERVLVDKEVLTKHRKTYGQDMR